MVFPSAPASDAPLFEPAAPAPDPPILRGQRAGALLEVVLCSGFPTQLLLILVLNVFGMRMQNAAGGLNPRFVITVSLLDATLVVLLIVMLLRAHRESVRDVLFGRVRLLREALLGLAMIPLVFLLVAVILAIIVIVAPQLRNVAQNPFEALLTTRADAAMFAVVAVIAGGVREEVQRGFIVHRFGQYLGGGVYGVLFYSIFFGLGHYEQGYDATIATAALGAVWGVTYLRRGSIIAPVISHSGFNLAQVVKHLALR